MPFQVVLVKFSRLHGGLQAQNRIRECYLIHQDKGFKTRPQSEMLLYSFASCLRCVILALINLASFNNKKTPYKV